MSPRRWLATAALVAACERGTPAPSDARSAIAVVRDASAHAADHVSSAAVDQVPSSATDVGARSTYAGTAEGRGAEPPIHQYVPHVGADPWSGHGSARFELPATDGVVEGTLTFEGLSFRVRGMRTGPRLRASIIPVEAARRTDDASADESAFRGTLEGELTGTELRGTWEASSEAGMHVRRGTFAAQRAGGG